MCPLWSIVLLAGFGLRNELEAQPIFGGGVNLGAELR